MAYDPVKAHEYYLKYKKKGLKKGRKKGKKAAQTSLLGVSASGLNSDGAIEAAAIKDQLKKEMNAALAKAKTDEEKMAIRKEYAKKANDEIAKLKADPKFAKAAKASKGSSGKASTGSKGGSSSKGISTSKTAASTTSSSEAAKQMVLQINAKMAELEDKLAKMPEEQREKAREMIRGQIDLLKEMLKQKK